MSALPTLDAALCSILDSRISRSGHPQEPTNQDNESEGNAAGQHRQIARSQSIPNRPSKAGPGLPPLDAMDDTSWDYEGDDNKEEKHRPVEAPLQTA
jgi:hypothetical protein